MWPLKMKNKELHNIVQHKVYSRQNSEIWAVLHVSYNNITLYF